MTAIKFLVVAALLAAGVQSASALTSSQPAEVKITRLTDFGGIVFNGVYSPRGPSRLAYAGARSLSGIWLADKDARNPVLIAPGARFQSFSPDGKKLAYHGPDGGAFAPLYVADSDGLNQVPVNGHTSDAGFHH